MTLRLSDLIAQWRWATRLELSDVATEIGISGSTLARFEKGENPSGDTLAKLMRWVLVDAPPLGRPAQAAARQLMLEDRREDHDRAD